MSIKIICEGKTEKQFKEILLRFVEEERARQGAHGGRARIRFVPQGGAVPMGDKLARLVRNLRSDPDNACVIALTDVYPRFRDAPDAKSRLIDDAGAIDGFYAHAAQYDFEAWLLPYWPVIARRIGVNVTEWDSQPEQVDNENPPAHRLSELYFRSSKTSRRSYKKTTEARDILKDQDLRVSAARCPELRSFLNTVLEQSGLRPLSQVMTP